MLAESVIEPRSTRSSQKRRLVVRPGITNSSSCVMYEEAYWNQVSINEMYFSLFDNINAKTETTSDE